MRRPSGLGRVPSRELSADDLLDIVGALAAAGVTTWLDGGWAVDASLGEQRRAHDDLDLLVDIADVGTLSAVLACRGFIRVSGAPPTSFELVDDEGRQVDVHPVHFTREGDGLYRMESGADWTYPAAGFAGEGYVLRRRVRCLTPEAQMLCRTGYALHRTSYDDVWALHDRFGLAVPPEYQRPRDTYPIRWS